MKVSSNASKRRTELRLLTIHKPTDWWSVTTKHFSHSLVKLVNKEQHNWDEYIDGVLFAYRTAKQSLPSLLHLR